MALAEGARAPSVPPVPTHMIEAVLWCIIFPYWDSPVIARAFPVTFLKYWFD